MRSSVPRSFPTLDDSFYLPTDMVGRYCTTVHTVVVLFVSSFMREKRGCMMVFADEKVHGFRTGMKLIDSRYGTSNQQASKLASTQVVRLLILLVILSFQQTSSTAQQEDAFH